MPERIQIRDVPDDVYAGMRRRAAEEGTSVPDLLRTEAARLAAQPGVRARAAMAADPDHVAPHVVDAEVLGVIRRARLRGEIDLTAATQAVGDLATWPAERVERRPLLARAWELRDVLSAPAALYVALAEALAVPLLSFDRRLARAGGLRCSIVIPGSAPPDHDRLRSP